MNRARKTQKYVRSEAHKPLAAMDELFERHADAMKVTVLTWTNLHLYIYRTRSIKDLLMSNAHFPIGVSIGDRSH